MTKKKNSDQGFTSNVQDYRVLFQFQYDVQVQLWSLLTHCLETVVTDHGHPVTAVSLACLGWGQVLVLSGSWKQEVRIYSQQYKSNLPSIRLPR